MTLPGLNVTQYMYVLFNQVHIYIQKPQFTLVPCSEMHVLHRIKDKLVLNATAVSDFKKALRQKHNIQ